MASKVSVTGGAAADGAGSLPLPGAPVKPGALQVLTHRPEVYGIVRVEIRPRRVSEKTSTHPQGLVANLTPP